MKNKFTLTTSNSHDPVVFQDKFNDHSETLNATQAWSLFFTGGKSKKSLGTQPVLGRAATAATVTIAVAGVFSSVS
jgi:hypothetical protein